MIAKLPPPGVINYPVQDSEQACPYPVFLRRLTDGAFQCAGCHRTLASLQYG